MNANRDMNPNSSDIKVNAGLVYFSLLSGRTRPESLATSNVSGHSRWHGSERNGMEWQRNQTFRM